MTLRTAIHDTRLIAELLTTAENEANSVGDQEPGAEHLLLAALLVTDSSARDALASLAAEVDAHAIRTAIRAVHVASLAAVRVESPNLDRAVPAAGGVYRSEVSAQQVFQRARVLSRRSPTGLRSTHVLLAAAEREHGTVARVLEHLGFDRAELIAHASASALVSDGTT